MVSYSRFRTFSNIYDEGFSKRVTLRKKCPYSVLFWPVFSRIRTEKGEIRSIFPFSVQMQENTDQNNSEYGHFSLSEILSTKQRSQPPFIRNKQEK